MKNTPRQPQRTTIGDKRARFQQQTNEAHEHQEFFVADVLRRKHLTIEYCPTDEMIGNFFTKPLEPSRFFSLRNVIMNYTPTRASPRT